MENKLKKRGGNLMQQTIDNSFYDHSKKIAKNNLVHFSSFRVQQENQKTTQIKEENSIIKRSNMKSKENLCIPRKGSIIISKQDQVLNGLITMKMLRFPATLRKNYEEKIRIITDLLNSPILSKSSIMRELKCLMSNSSSHDSYLLSKNLCKQVKELLRQTNGLEKYVFRYEEMAIFLKKIQERKCDQLLEAYNNMLQAYNYPTSVELMLLYIGVHLYSINSHYVKAQEICYRMHDLMIKRKIDPYIPIFLILMIKLKSNQGHWESCLPLISRALAAAWLYNQPDLEIWCYFEFSRTHFAMGNTYSAEFFRQRFEMNILESRQAIFRQMMMQAYQKQLQVIRSHNYSYDEKFVITEHQLSKNPERQKPSSSLKAQVYAKTITQNFKIKHVKNLIGRLGEEFVKSTEGCLAMAGNPQFLTHESGIKNLNVYFRQGGEQKQYYTFENSSKNVLVLKEMIRNTLLEMKWFLPIIDS